jgi:hypothetical protein
MQRSDVLSDVLSGVLSLPKGLPKGLSKGGIRGGPARHVSAWPAAIPDSVTLHPGYSHQGDKSPVAEVRLTPGRRGVKYPALALLGLCLLLAACSSSPQRAAPVTESEVAGAGQEAQTFGYSDGGFGTGFSDTQPTTLAAVGQQMPREVPLAERVPANNPSSSTVLALLRTAEGQKQAGNLAGAAATLERALRIQPRNAALWHQLAGLRYQQGQYARAGSLAGKSNALAGDNSTLRRNNWLLIAKVKKAQGDPEGAAEAKAQAGY